MDFDLEIKQEPEYAEEFDFLAYQRVKHTESLFVTQHIVENVLNRVFDAEITCIALPNAAKAVFEKLTDSLCNLPAFPSEYPSENDSTDWIIDTSPSYSPPDTYCRGFLPKSKEEQNTTPAFPLPDLKAVHIQSTVQRPPSRYSGTVRPRTAKKRSKIKLIKPKVEKEDLKQKAIDALAKLHVSLRNKKWTYNDEGEVVVIEEVKKISSGLKSASVNQKQKIAPGRLRGSKSDGKKKKKGGVRFKMPNAMKNQQLDKRKLMRSSMKGIKTKNGVKISGEMIEKPQAQKKQVVEIEKEKPQKQTVVAETPPPKVQKEDRTELPKHKNSRIVIDGGHDVPQKPSEVPHKDVLLQTTMKRKKVSHISSNPRVTHQSNLDHDLTSFRSFPRAPTKTIKPKDKGLYDTIRSEL
ncbi:hypothetical protein PCE1_004454 [Barthelona sp. PCE]